MKEHQLLGAAVIFIGLVDIPFMLGLVIPNAKPLSNARRPATIITIVTSVGLIAAGVVTFLYGGPLGN